MSIRLDRIVEAYQGKLGVRLQEASINRLHWICEHAKGNFVLDVGCSQGMCSVLLGKKGFKTTGIDIAQESIAFAEEFLQSEEPETQNNVTFICDDFCQHDFGAQQFDTIVLSEVLEHLTHPADFLGRAQQLLSPGGTVIITVPFGINDFPDHKQTYYFTDVYALLSQFYTVVDLGLFNGWIGLIGTNDRNAAAMTVDAATFKKVEVNFFENNRLLLDDMNKLRESAADLRQRLNLAQGRLDDASAKYRNAQAQIADQKDRLVEMNKHRESAADLSQRLNLTQGRLEDANTKYRNAQAQIADQKDRLEKARLAYEEALQKFGDALRASDERLSERERQLAEANQKNTAAEKQIGELTVQNTDQKDQLEKARLAYEEAQNNISKMEEALQISADALRASDERLSERERQLAEANQKNAAAEKQIGELTAQNAETTSQLGRAMGAVYDADDALDRSRGIIYSLHYDLSKLDNDLRKLSDDLRKQTAEKNDLWNLLNRSPLFLFAWSCYKRLRVFAHDTRLGRGIAKCCRVLAIDKLLRFLIGKLRK